MREILYLTKSLELPLGESLKKSAEERLELYRDHQPYRAK